MKVKFLSIISIICLLLVGCGTDGSSNGAINFDLTKMNLEMKCATFERIHETYEANLEKTIKIDGMYDRVTYDNGNTYHLVWFYDTTGCCPYYMEWIPNTETLPEIGQNIIVTGTFTSYMEGTDIFTHLVDTTLEISQ